jgi:hypothetical protein
MLKLPPPIWGLAYVLIAAAMSYVAGCHVSRVCRASRSPFYSS